VFAGTPAELRDVAAGQVWITPQRPDGVGAQRLPDGRYRIVRSDGPPSGDAEATPPTVADGYMLSLGGGA
jgi:hypothetical protein